jgi:beta-lactamase regulating signal transducer with metallopeptidase domain
MPLAVYLPLVFGLALAVAAPRLASALPPRAAVWSLSVAAVVSSLSWIVSLALIANTAVDRISFVARHEHYSVGHWRHVDPVWVPLAMTAGVVLIGSVTALAVVTVREFTSVREVRRLSHGFVDPDTVVYVDDAVPHAYTLGGRQPRIVVSNGLLRKLDRAERAAVLAHESAHLLCRHHTHLRVLRLAAAANPALRGVARAGALAVERWADEEAAGRLGDRRLVARTLVRAALAGTHTAAPTGTLGHTSGDVGRRVEALLAAPLRPRWTIVAVSAALVLAAALSPVYAADRIGALLSAPCPTVHTVQ